MECDFFATLVIGLNIWQGEYTGEFEHYNECCSFSAFEAVFVSDDMHLFILRRHCAASGA